MNRDIALLLAGYVTRPAICRLFALSLADSYAMITRKLRDSGKYDTIYHIPMSPKSVKCYIVLYDNKRKYNHPIKFHPISEYDLKSIFMYKFDKLSLEAIISRDAYFTLLSYKYDKYHHFLYKYNKLMGLLYRDIVKYAYINRGHYLSIHNILQITDSQVIFDNYSFKFYGYNNFYRYYKGGTRFVSSRDGAVIVYYETGAIMLEFSYKSAAFYEKYEFIRDSLRIYSPLGTRLM